MAGTGNPSQVVVEAAAVVVSQNIVVQFREASAFQFDAVQADAFQTLPDGDDAFQPCGFQDDAFQTSPCPPSPTGFQHPTGSHNGQTRRRRRDYAVQENQEIRAAMRRSRILQEDEELVALVASFVRTLQ